MSDYLNKNRILKYRTFYSDYKIWYIKSISVIAYLVCDETHTNFDEYQKIWLILCLNFDSNLIKLCID